MEKNIEKGPTVNFSGFKNNDIVNEKVLETAQQWRNAKSHAHELHQQFLEEKAEIAKLNGNLSLEQAIQQMQQIIATKRNFTILGQIMEQSKFGKGLSMIKVPDIATSGSKTVVNAQEIEKLLLERNCNHYAQANGTLLTTEDF
jgi:hypothetical protein